MAKLARRRKLQKQKEKAAKFALKAKLDKIKRQIESKYIIKNLKFYEGGINLNAIIYDPIFSLMRDDKISKSFIKPFVSIQ